MVEILIEAKDLIDAGKLKEAKAKIDEVIAGANIQKAPEKEDIKPTDPPLPGEGTNGF